MGQFLTAPVPSTKMPKGIPYIIGNEAAERFSFYGMRTLLFVFMTQYLVNAQGDPAYFTETQAREYQAWFTSAAYFTPFLGAFIADALWGKYKTILYVSLLYCLGHASLALMDSPSGFLQATFDPKVYFLIGLVLIALGAGGIKPCVSANVGDQFGRSNKHLITKVFGWFYFSINLGSFFSTLLTPWLLNEFGPWLAFGVPGVLMFVATWAFWAGRKKYVHIPPTGIDRYVDESLDHKSWVAIGKLLPIYLLIAVFWSCYDQSASAWVGQATRLDRQFLGIEWFESQIQAINPLLILLFIPLFNYVVYPAVDKVWLLTPVRKIGLGMFLTVVTFALSATIEQWTVDAQDSFHRDHAQRIERGEADLAMTLAFLETEGRPGAAEGLLEGHFGRDNVRLFEGATSVPEKSKWDLDALAAVEKRVQHRDEANKAADLSPADAAAKNRELRETLVAAIAAGEALTSDDGSAVDANAEAALDPEPWFAAGAVGYVGEAPQFLHRPNVIWQLLAFVLLTAAEVMVSITALEFSYTQAPPKAKSLVMAFYLASVSLGNAFTALVNRFTADADGNSTLVGADYYWFFTEVMLGAAIVYVVVGLLYKPKEYIQEEGGDGASA
ncbi:MAG: MFS transporter [Planctomycetota bacterium]